MTSATAHRHPQHPSPWVRRFAPLLPAGGTVLDLACGGGRHSRYFVTRGHPVTAVDRNLTAVEDLREQAELITADLEDGAPWPLAGRRFALVVVTNYLFRPLFPAIVGAVADGGLLIYETFGLGNECFSRPRNPDHLLRPGELLERVQGELQVIAYETGVTPQPAVVQRIVARRGDEPVALPDAQYP